MNLALAAARRAGWRALEWVAELSVPSRIALRPPLPRQLAAALAAATVLAHYNAGIGSAPPDPFPLPYRRGGAGAALLAR